MAKLLRTRYCNCVTTALLSLRQSLRHRRTVCTRSTALALPPRYRTPTARPTMRIAVRRPIIQRNILFL